MKIKQVFLGVALLCGGFQLNGMQQLKSIFVQDPAFAEITRHKDAKNWKELAKSIEHHWWAKYEKYVSPNVPLGQPIFIVAQIQDLHGQGLSVASCGDRGFENFLLNTLVSIIRDPQAPRAG